MSSTVRRLPWPFRAEGTGISPLKIVQRAGFLWLTLGASIALFVVSRGKWSDALVDSGREWIVPDSLARGDLLYRDVVYWFGPFTPYFHAAFFKLLGSSFRTLVIAGVVGSAGTLIALYLALRIVTEKREAVLWTALAVPVLVFMPNAGGSILGMGYRMWHAAAFALGAVVVASGGTVSRRPLSRAILVGILCALAGLCRTEWGLAALLASVLATAYGAGRRLGWRSVATTLTAFLLLFGGTIAVFCLAAGWKSVVEDCHVLLTGLPTETRLFLLNLSGVRDWESGLAQMLYSAAMWLGVYFLLELAAIHPVDPQRLRRRVSGLAVLFLVLALAAVLGGAGGAIMLSAAPAVCIGALVVGLRNPRERSAVALSAFGLLGVFVSFRRPFHISDSPYVGPPLLFAFVCAAALLSLAVGREHVPVARARLAKAVPGFLCALIALSFAVRFRGYLDDPRIAIPGTNGMLSARPEAVAEVVSVARTVRLATPQGGGLIVFPEGEVLNHLSGRPNPLRNKLYIPGYLTEENELEILRELTRAGPTAIAIWDRPISEYGRTSFGFDYGVSLSRWSEENCDHKRFAPKPRVSRTRPRIQVSLCTAGGS